MREPALSWVGDLRQSWPRPSAPRPIVIIGAGGIVQDAHMPAYRLVGLPVAGVYDLNPDRAALISHNWGIPALPDLAAAAAIEGAVFDLALPPGAHLSVMPALPRGAIVLIQKPMGRDLAEAGKIMAFAAERNLVAAVNFQLRFAPMMLALKAMIEQGRLGHLTDIEVHLNLFTPWHLFPFLKGLPRMEIANHSIHYLDLIRHMAGEPVAVLARTLKHPLSDLAQTRTAAILDFGSADLRCTLSINHDHDFGRRFQAATIRFEGTDGAAFVKLGQLLDYPTGEPDELWFARRGTQDWQQIALQGSWFPNAFVGPMSNLQRVAAGEGDRLVSPLEDAWRTMALVEACFQSSAAPGTPVPRAPTLSGDPA